ncbi:hypothetical protein H0W91_00460 [Patescibacteria group bacterium]|nr:hypothetical protein [Patescibacteria group bacterium]
MKKNINKISFAILSVLVLFPVVSFAALDGIKGLLLDIRQILHLTEPVIIGLAFLYFFWGVGQFILHAGDSKTRDEGKQKMIWGVVALFVIISIMGIISFIGNALGIKPSGIGAGAGGTTLESHTTVPNFTGTVGGSSGIYQTPGHCTSGEDPFAANPC